MTPLHIFASLKIPLAEKVTKKDLTRLGTRVRQTNNHLLLRLTLQQYEECADLLLRAGGSPDVEDDDVELNVFYESNFEVLGFFTFSNGFGIGKSLSSRIFVEKS